MKQICRQNRNNFFIRLFPFSFFSNLISGNKTDYKAGTDCVNCLSATPSTTASRLVSLCDACCNDRDDNYSNHIGFPRNTPCILRIPHFSDNLYSQNCPIRIYTLYKCTPHNSTLFFSYRLHHSELSWKFR